MSNRMVTVDAVVIRGEYQHVFNDKREILLVTRGKDPFKGYLALPGGRVEDNENCEQAVVRELLEETGIKAVIDGVYPPYVLSDPERDPRGPSLNVAYMLVNPKGKVKGADDAEKAAWYPLQETLNSHKLAFDHESIVHYFIYNGHAKIFDEHARMIQGLKEFAKVMNIHTNIGQRP